MKVNFNGGEISGISRKYWFDLKETFLDQNNKNLSYSEILNHSHKLITESVKSQLISDAKVGSFLSGGIDSSLITAIMAKELNSLETFTLGSSDERFDESDLVKKIARYLNISNNLIFLEDVNIELHLDNLAASFSEPLADSSQLPASIVSSIASKKVKSVLTGDGGDEVFGGYYRYGPGLKTWRYLSKLKKIPIINKFLILAETNIPKKIFHIISKLGINNARDKIRKLINLNSITNLEDYYLYLMSNSLEKSPSYLKLMSEKKILLNRIENLSDETNLYYWDQKNYLSDNNLAKIDRITMFYSLESRAPFLDKKLISFVNSISHSQKVKFGLKSILKDIHSIYFPKKFRSSAKKGFSFPLDSIIRTKLKDWSHYWLNYNSHNLLDLRAVNKLWKLHLSGINYSPDLWRIICFNRWHFFHKKKNYSV
jgi:asparagine synthase (glutamine-hydrolysing)